MPVREQARSVRSGDVSLAVREWSSNRRRPTIVLHHGLASSSHIWDLVAPVLARRARVVAYDARGHGLSGASGSGFDFARTTGDLERVRAAARAARPVIVGHSWGANVALEYAVGRPRSTAGIVLLDGGFLEMGDRMTWSEARLILSPPRLAGMKLEDLLAGARAMWGRDWTPAVERVLLSLFHVRGGRVRPRLGRADHLRILRALFLQPTMDLLRRVQVPTLVLAARPSRPSAAEAGFLEAKREAAGRVRRIGGVVTFEWIAGVHDVPLQRPEAVASRIAAFAATAATAARAGRASLPERP